MAPMESGRRSPLQSLLARPEGRAKSAHPVQKERIAQRVRTMIALRAQSVLHAKTADHATSRRHAKTADHATIQASSHVQKERIVQRARTMIALRAKTALHVKTRDYTTIGLHVKTRDHATIGPPYEDRGPRNDRAPREDRGPRNEQTPYENRGPRPAKGSFKGGIEKHDSGGKRFYAPKFKTAETHARTDGAMRLNRHLAMSGICSRREADKLIADGMVMVNGQIVTEMGFMVNPSDEVRYAGDVLKAEKKVYLLLNKPKGFITTMDDERARKTVMDIVGGACKERIYPVGRLDRATTGVLLFTNDGDLAKKLTHPSHGAKKIYHIALDKALGKRDFSSLQTGIELEDGPIKADELHQVDEKDKKTFGLAIHSGRNRIVRRMFEHLGYQVDKLDRVEFAGLTKKNLARGQWRFLNQKEVSFLQML